MMKKEPFDRHDWFVDQGDGVGERRYVIDFYGGEDENGRAKGFMSRLFSDSGGGNNTNGVANTQVPKAPSMYIDVRPALDDTQAVSDHAAMLMKRTFPGIYEAVGSSSNGTSSSSSGSVTYANNSSGANSMVGVLARASNKTATTGLQPKSTTSSSSSSIAK